MPVRRTTIAVPEPFELELALHGHGFIALAPNEWDAKSKVWRTALRAGSVVRGPALMA